MTGSSARKTQVVGAAAVVCAVSIGWACVASAGASTAQVSAASPQSPAAPTTVWSGVYTDEQAKRGEVVSNDLCVSCHGPGLSGGEAGPALVGLEFVGAWNNLTLADFFDRVHATMPADAPGTLTPQQTSDVTAYVLRINKYPAGKTDLPTDLAALKSFTIVGQPPAQ